MPPTFAGKREACTPKSERSAHTLHVYGDTAMKSAITRGLVLVLVLLGFLAVVPLASAQRTNHAGTICKNYKAEDAALIEYDVAGIRSLKTSDTNIICPLVRNTSNSNNGAFIHVDVSHTGTQTTSCTAYSY